MLDTLHRRINETIEFIQDRTPLAPEIGLILGSGLGGLADEYTDQTVIPYREIPHFAESTVAGHASKLVIGRLGGKAVVTMQGRFHYYEGYRMDEVTYPIRVMQKLGVKNLLVTNAAGGISRDLRPGDVMLITDHINLMGTNPLIGPNDPKLGPRFPDLSEAYHPDLISLAAKVAADIGLPLKKGIYAALSGPTYETPAEIRFLRAIGADAVGMSTVPEVIVAKHGGIRVLGLSAIANQTDESKYSQTKHDEVMAKAREIGIGMLPLVRGVVREL